MKSYLFLRQLLLIFTIMLAVGCANSATPGTATAELLKKIENTLGQGQAVIVYHMTNMDRTTEQYADWSASLNEFSSAHADKYKVFSADIKFKTMLVKSNFGRNKEFTVFMKKDYPTYYYDGVIVEQAVYIAIDNKYSGKPLSGMDKAFLPKEINFSLK
ncbi:MAG: hypothetical protein GC149_01695 [Gammaproteobacteria bacterium]|nr:hypothetical protein [Gammaproteobacteria bacterium]